MRNRFRSQPNNNPPSFPEVIATPVSWGDLDLQRAHDHKAIVNPETGKVFSIVSKDYKLIRHEEAAVKVHKIINENSELGKFEVSTEFYNDGGRMRMTYRFYEQTVEIRSGDPVNPELQLFNSYDTSWPFGVILGAFRMVCTNGLVIGKKFLHIRKRHVYEFDKIDLEEQVSTALKRFRLQTNQWRKWADRTLKEKQYQKTIESMKFGKGAIEEIEERTAGEARSFDNKGFPIISLWVFYNVITWYITHRAVSLNHRVEMEKRLRVALKGF